MKIYVFFLFLQIVQNAVHRKEKEEKKWNVMKNRQKRIKWKVLIKNEKKADIL